MNNVRVLWGLIGGLILLLAVVSWSWYKQAGHAQTMAVIGKQAITESEWVQALKQKHGQQVLTDLINRQVVFQEAKRLGITLDEKRVQAEVGKMQDSYGHGSEDFDQSLKEEAGITKQELLDEFRYHMLLEDIAIQDIDVEESQIRDYYQSHQEEFGQPAMAKLSMITVASEEEAEQVHQELQQGANFSTLAKERSIDSLTAANGGDLGWVSLLDDMVPQIVRDAIPTLSIGENSKPIAADGRYAIIQVHEKKKAAQLSYEEAKAQIQRQLALAQVSLDDVLAKLKQGLGIKVNSENFH